MTERLRVGSRGSPLALAQTDEVLARLRGLHPETTFDTVVIKTHGDEGDSEGRSGSLDGKRAFTKRIEDALLAGGIDFAVHSLKDLPTGLPPGLTIAAMPSRSDPRDVLVANDGLSTATLAPGTRIGTSSLRRKAQLLARWPGLAVKELRGNVGTRLQRLDAREFDGLVVAAAGLRRLRLEHRIAEPLSPDVVTPAPGQGALAVETRSQDCAIFDLLASIDDADARRAAEAERDLSARIGGSCNVPLGALATFEEGALVLRAVVASPDGRRIVRAMVRAPADAWREIVDKVATRLMEGGANEILREVAS